MENLNYAVIYEQTREAIELPIADLKAPGLPAPQPGSSAVVLGAGE